MQPPVVLAIAAAAAAVLLLLIYLATRSRLVAVPANAQRLAALSGLPVEPGPEGRLVLAEPPKAEVCSRVPRPAAISDGTNCVRAPQFLAGAPENVRREANMRFRELLTIRADRAEAEKELAVLRSKPTNRDETGADFAKDFDLLTASRVRNVANSEQALIAANDAYANTCLLLATPQVVGNYRHQDLDAARAQRQACLMRALKIFDDAYARIQREKDYSRPIRAEFYRTLSFAVAKNRENPDIAEIARICRQLTRLRHAEENHVNALLLLAQNAAEDCRMFTQN